VRSQATASGLFAFDAITERFPIGDVAGNLAYAQGTAMVDYVIDEYGREAIARLTAAYRGGASDEEALEAATGVGADELYAAFYAQFGVDAPTPVEPEPIAPSDVDIPEPGTVDPGGVVGGPSAEPAEPAPGPAEPGGAAMEPVLLVIVLAVAIALVAVVAVLVARRAARAASP
jgi:hypothetical protein